MLSAKRLGHVTLTTPDMQRQIEYYTDVIGLSLVDRSAERAVLATRVGQEAVVLEKGEPGVLSRVAFQIAPDSDLDELAAALQKEGVRSERRSGITPGVARAIIFEDPKGTLVEVYSDYVFPPPDNLQTGIMPVKLGHVASRVQDVQKVTEFYQKILGFRVSDWRGDFFVFMRCSTDHHTVNFVRDDVPQLHHIAFEVKDWPEIHRSCDFLAKNGIHLVYGPLRHIIGHNIAAYHRNSDNVRVEIFCEMDQMKDESLGYFEPRPWHQDRPQKPKMWGPETLRNYWGFAATGQYPGYP
jgi:catechol 2,3-dioxygenase-like lactoylglutathione lyase family enzyme